MNRTLTHGAQHQNFMRDYATYYNPDLLQQLKAPKGKTEDEILKENHRFLRTEKDDGDLSWEKRIAKKYYDKLFKEYALVELRFYKEGRLAMRWRNEKEVIRGKGQFTCAGLRCEESKGLQSWEVNFAYVEDEEKKNALVKIRLCEPCSYKLNYKKAQQRVEPKRKSEAAEEPQKKKSRSSSDRTNRRESVERGRDARNNDGKEEGKEEEARTSTSTHAASDESVTRLSSWKRKPETKDETVRMESEMNRPASSTGQGSSTHHQRVNEDVERFFEELLPLFVCQSRPSNASERCFASKTMTITVRATFSQEGVFFAGEKLNCTITFTNPLPPQAASNGALLPPRPLQDMQLSEGNANGRPNGQHQNGAGNGHRAHLGLQQQSSAIISGQQHQQSSAGLNRDRTANSALSPTSPASSHSALTSPYNSPLNADIRAQTRPTASLMHNSNASALNNGHSSNTFENGNKGQQRPGVNTSRNFSQGRVSTDISHIDAMPRDLPDLPSQGKPLPAVQDTEQPDQGDQDDQEQTNIVVPPPPTADSNLETSSESPASPTPRQQQQMQEQQQLNSSRQGDFQSINSPGLLGLASFMYRSASFSSLASAFGLSGGEPEPAPQYDDKKLPPLPPQEYFGGADSRQSLTVLPPTQIMSPENEEEKTTKESLQVHSEQDTEKELESIDPEQLARIGTPIGLGLGSQSSHSRTATGGSLNGLHERMIELQVTDNADTQSVIDDGEYQTPRPSMDYSTRSSMQSVRGPFQHQFYQETPTRRSSVMSTYSTVGSSRLLHNQGTKKETLLWGSVQVMGQFMVDGSFIRQQGFESLKSKTMYRTMGSSGGGAIGGGTLGTVGASDWRDRANANRLFPVFSTPPSILFVDLQLAPGESTSYTYQIELPSDLPPSHRGKTIRFAYNLVLGVQRGSVHTPAKNVQIPFRLYNNISELGTRPTYDLMSPVILHKDTAISGLVGQSRASEKTIDNPKLARRQFEDYVDELLRNIQPVSDEQELDPAHTRELTRRESDAYKDEEEVHSHTCLEKVALLSRSASSASYDICKNNVPVAKLSLIKTRFKLGETVHGVISFTSREIPTYQISVTLETVEAIEPNYACRSAVQTAKLTKRVHAELHESCIDTMRTSFSLCIPPTATPEFKTSTLTLKWYLRVEFITGPANQARFKMTSVDERRSQYQAVEALSTESFDCSVPIQVYPTSYETGALFPPTSTFSLDK
ncbi:hypothetical protein BGZ83_003972 [Gryganskiella cystojenkinii]|nr:hypothetical protein BGZ83_003972 [Gryganskiella cystojenkinii]